MGNTWSAWSNYVLPSGVMAAYILVTSRDVASRRSYWNSIVKLTFPVCFLGSMYCLTSCEQKAWVTGEAQLSTAKSLAVKIPVFYSLAGAISRLLYNALCTYQPEDQQYCTLTTSTLELATEIPYIARVSISRAFAIPTRDEYKELQSQREQLQTRLLQQTQTENQLLLRLWDLEQRMHPERAFTSATSSARETMSSFPANEPFFKNVDGLRTGANSSTTTTPSSTSYGGGGSAETISTL